MSVGSFPKFPLRVRSSWFVIALLALFAGLSVQYTFKAIHKRSAFERWRNQLQQFEDVDIYKRFNFPNPPIMALILEPFSALPSPYGALAWFYLKVGMTLLAFFWVFKMVESPDLPFPPWAKMLTVLLGLRPIMGDLFHGNVNLFILFLVVACLYAYKRGRDFTSGVVLALGIACKVTPALFVPYFLWKRAWKTLAGVGVGLVLFLLLIPGLRLGMAENLNYLHSWSENMVVPYVKGGQVWTDHNNQSLPGLAYRMFTHSPSFSTYINDVYTPVKYHNILALEPAQARWLIKFCTVLFACLVVWSCRTPTRLRHGWRLTAEFAIISLGMLLFSERTWKHHCVMFLIPFAVICYYLYAFRLGGLLRGYLIGSLAVVFVLMTATSTGVLGNAEAADKDQYWDVPAKMAQVYGAFVWAYFILLAALVVLLQRKELAPPFSPGETAHTLIKAENHGHAHLNMG